MEYSSEVVEWLLSGELDVIGEVSELRRTVRLHGKGLKSYASACDGILLTSQSYGDG